VPALKDPSDMEASNIPAVPADIVQAVDIQAADKQVAARDRVPVVAVPEAGVEHYRCFYCFPYLIPFSFIFRPYSITIFLCTCSVYRVLNGILKNRKFSIAKLICCDIIIWFGRVQTGKGSPI
jgi:hypothetical protein